MHAAPHGSRIGKGLLAGLALLGLSTLGLGQAPSPLRIGITPKLIGERTDGKDSLSRDNLTKFIKGETDLANEVITAPDYRKLAEQLDKSELHVGVFNGLEFAWAKERYPNLQPLAVAINELPNRYVHVVARKDNQATDFGGLKGQTIALPKADPGYAELFVNRQSQALGKTPKELFSRIVESDNQETALDDVVDGVIQAAAVDRVALSAYKRRKPGRFDQLKEVAHSEALPPPVVAYRNGVLDKATLQRLQSGLENARNRSEGQTLLTLARLTGFESPPANFEQQLAEIRKAYPPPGDDKP